MQIWLPEIFLKIKIFSHTFTFIMKRSAPTKNFTEWRNLRASGPLQNPYFLKKTEVRNFLNFQKAFYGKVLYTVL
jgi:hypothetical protein